MVTPDSKNIDVEIAIRTSRILKVLDETIEKIELALCLPVFLKNLDRFTNNLTDDEFNALKRCKIYQRHGINKNEHDVEEIKLALSTESLKKKLQSSTGAQHFKMEYEKPTIYDIEDPNVKMPIYILWKHPELVNVAKSEYLQFNKESPKFIFLEKMQSLRQCAYTRMMEDLSPEAERKKSLHYKDIWYKNEEAITKVNALKPQLNDIMAQAQVELEGKNKVISEMCSRMKNFEIKYKEEIEKICTNSEKNMAIENKSSEAHEEVIQNDIKNLDATFQSTLNEHLKEEKELRLKRSNIERKLEASLETYDNDMGERQAEYEEILAEYEDERQQMATLQEKFDEQDREYLILMEEKAYEEHLELERRIEELRRRVAARIIQTHWRALKQRRLERAKSKKARKGKGKKKGGEKPKSPQKK